MKKHIRGLFLFSQVLLVLFMLSSCIMLSSCSGSLAVSLHFSSSAEKGFHLVVENNTTSEIIVSGNGYLLPVLGPGDTSDDYYIHMFDLGGFYFSVASPTEEFPLFEEITDTVPTDGGGYRLTIDAIDVVDGETTVTYSMGG